MGAKWFCNKCGKEIWKDLNKADKMTFTVAEMEEHCICSNCILKDIQEERENQVSEDLLEGKY